MTWICGDSDTDGDSSTPKQDTPVTMKNFLCDDGAAVTFNKESPIDGGTNIIQENITLDSNFAVTNASASVAAEGIASQDNGSGFSFDSTDFIGAVKPGTTPWWNGWVLPGSLPTGTVPNIQ